MEKRKMTYALLLLLMSSMLFFMGCYPNDDATVEDWDITVTLKDPDFADFYLIKTYTLVDTVSHGDGTTIRSLDSKIIATVEENLEKLGWTKSESVYESDVIIFCSVTNTDYYSYWYDYWYPYWDYYFPGFYPYYPYSWGGGISYDYSEGTLMIQMNYTKPVNEADRTKVIWMGIVDGVLNDTQISIEKRLERGINQCFVDSPYLLGTTHY